MTYSIKASQKIFYSNIKFCDISEIKMLIIFCFFLPVSFLLFKKAVYISKKLGNLNQY
jgi:hypothetical protein